MTEALLLHAEALLPLPYSSSFLEKIARHPTYTPLISARQVADIIAVGAFCLRRWQL